MCFRNTTAAVFLLGDLNTDDKNNYRFFRSGERILWPVDRVSDVIVI